MTWTDFLQTQGASQDGRNFGKLALELEDARSATIVAPLTDLGVIAVNGEDAVPFLNNMLTNDIKSLASVGACLGGLCNPKGRLLATMNIWRTDQGLCLALSADLLAAIQKKLAMYVMRSKVQLNDETQLTLLLGLSGPKAALALSGLGVDIGSTAKLRKFPDGEVIHLGGDRYLLAVCAQRAEETWKQLTKIASPVGLDAWHWLEIVAGIPCITAKLQEEFVPQMINYDRIGGVSFSKGCYPGQEIVARSQYLGKIKRHMYRVFAADEARELQAGAELYSSSTPDQPCGMVVQAAPSPVGGTEALAVLQSSCFEAGDLHLGSLGGPVLRFLPLPYAHHTEPENS